MKNTMIAMSLAALLAATTVAGCGGSPELILSEEMTTEENTNSQPTSGDCTAINGSNLPSGSACDDNSDCASNNCYVFEGVCECIGDGGSL